METTVDILQVLCTASTWGGSALGFSGPVELEKRNFSFCTKIAFLVIYGLIMKDQSYTNKVTFEKVQKTFPADK